MRIEDLMRRATFQCRQCGLELTINGVQGREPLAGNEKAERDESFDAAKDGEGGAMADEGEKLGQAGAPDPALRTSPIARAGDANASFNCWYNGLQYSNGALLCMEGELFQCSYGVWIDQGRSCGPAA
jgi:hypothetical protein